MKYKWSKVPSIPVIFKILKKRVKFENEELSNLFFDTLEDFFYYGTLEGYIKNDNFKNILLRLINIKKVSYLMPIFNEKKSVTTNDKTSILLAPDLRDDELKYFMLKEIIRCASSISHKTTKNIANKHLMSKGVYGEETAFEDLYLEKGFRLLEEGIVIDMTENIYHAIKSKKRPAKISKLEKDVFGRNTKFLSNFRYHPSFQEITTMVVRGIVSKEEVLSDDNVLHAIGRSSLYNGFSNTLFDKLRVLYGDSVFDVIGKLGIIYKKETDVHEENIIRNSYLRVIHTKRAYKDLMKYIPREKVLIKAC